MDAMTVSFRCPDDILNRMERAVDGLVIRDRTQLLLMALTDWLDTYEGADDKRKTPAPEGRTAGK